VATPDTIRCELVWQMSGLDFALNVLHYTTGATGPLLSDDVSQMSSAIGAAWVASGGRVDYANEMALHRIRVRDIRTAGQPVLESNITTAGTASLDTLPLQTCVVSTIRTTTYSRRGRGRIYWPAPSVATLTTTGTLSAAAAGRFNAWVTDLMSISGGSLGPLTLSVLSRADNVARSVIAVNTDPSFDVQTRRRDTSIS
jgi:hypothetical protein